MKTTIILNQDLSKVMRTKSSTDYTRTLVLLPPEYIKQFLLFCEGLVLER